MSNNATKKLRKALIFGKIVIFYYFAISSLALAEQIKTRWFSVALDNQQWQAANDPSGFALLAVKRRDNPLITLNIIRLPSKALKQSIDGFRSTLASDYKSAGFTGVLVDELAREQQIAPFMTGIATYHIGSSSEQTAVVSYVTTLDDSDLWVTSVAPADKREQAIEFHLGFIGALDVSQVNEDKPNQSSSNTVSYLVLLAVLVATIFIVLRRRRLR